MLGRVDDVAASTAPLAATAAVLVDRAWATRHKLVVWRRWREHQALTQGRGVPWMQPPQQRPPLRAQQPPPAVQDGGQHLHIHLGGLSVAERAEVMRQLRGSR